MPGDGPVIIANTIMLTLHGLLDNRDFVHVLCYRTATAPTSAQVIAVAQWAYTSLLPQLRVMNTPHLVWTHAVAKSVHAANGYQYQQPFTSNNTGTRGVNGAAANVAGVTNWHTSFSGRSFQGRSYFGGFDTNDQFNSILQGVIMQLLTAFVAWLLGHPPQTGISLAVGSRKLHGGTVVTGWDLNNSVDDIGRRLPGHGS